VRVTVVAADASGSGVEQIRFTTNRTVPTRHSGYEYTSPFVVRTLTHLSIRAFDRAGNAGEPLAITVRSLADRLVFGAPARLSVRPSQGYLQARVSSTVRAHVLAVMTGRTLKAPQRWRFPLESGAWIVKLRLPSPIGRSESYTVRWTVSAGTRRTTRVTQVTVR
jgi:hypothetical protein